MAAKRIGIMTGGVLAGALLLGTAGLALAQDPSPAPATGPSWSSGMMGGSGMTGGSGMMGPGTLTPDQREKIEARHDRMMASGTCDPAEMRDFHTQLPSQT